MKRVACIGECMMELVERPDGTLTRAYGGDTLNTALYLARLGVPTEYITVLGADPFSDEMVHAWEREEIGITGVVRLQGRLPGLYLIRTDNAGERSFFYWRDSAPVRQLFGLPDTPFIQAILIAAELIYLSGTRRPTSALLWGSCGGGLALSVSGATSTSRVWWRSGRG